MLCRTISYKTELSKEEIKEGIKSLISQTVSNSWKNHFSPKDSSRNAVRGVVDRSFFTFWIIDSFLLGSLYPICIGKVSETSTELIVKIKIKFNPVAELFLIISNLILISYLIFGIIIQENNAFTFLWKRTIVALVIFCLLNAVPLYTYLHGKKRLINLLRDTLNLE